MALKETLKRILWRQLGKPSGLQGRIIGKLMTSSNASAHDLTLANAAVKANDRVLEVGFGGGALAEKTLSAAPGVTVSGVDTSEVMVKMANNRLGGAIREGRTDLKLGDVSSLPYADASFDKALSVHSIYFWSDPTMDLGEVQRTLVPGGLFVVTIDPTEPMQEVTAKRAGHGRWSEEALLTILEHSGLVEIGSDFDAELGLVCAWGGKPASLSSQFRTR